MAMPDKWEYPWFAAWDHAFHAVALARIDPDFAKRLQSTLAGYDADEIWRALQACVDLYCDLRADQPPPMPRTSAEHAVRAWVASMQKGR